MSTSCRLLTAAVITLVAITSCGQDDAPTAGTPRRPAAAPATAGGRTTVNCLAGWAQGTTGTFACEAMGPSKDTVKLSADTLVLDRICVNDERLTTYGFGGSQTAPIAASGTPRCADLGGVKRLPESCTCVPPAGGDCTPPSNGGKFLCVITGHVG